MRIAGLGECLIGLVVAAAATAQAPVTTWSLGRSGHALASNGTGLVLFGGSWSVSSGGLFGDTWTRSGGNWSLALATGSGPSARTGHAITFDSTRSEIVLFGGQHSSGESGETWVYSGGLWLPRKPGPPGRTGHAMAYDESRDRVVLFGGLDSSFELNDTWEWDGSQWTQIQVVTAPSRRRHHAMGYDEISPGVGRIVLFGGIGANGALNDTWGWDGTTWTQLAQAAPSPARRSGHAVARDQLQNNIVLFGGQLDSGPNQYLNDTWTWNGTAWIQPPVVGTQPPPRGRHAMAFDSDPSVRSVIVFAGENNTGLLQDSWEWDGTRWTEPHPAPSARVLGATAYDAVRDQTVLFGGRDATGLLNDTWVWNGLVWVRARPANTPNVRLVHAMAFDEARGRVVLYGGWGGGYPRHSDTWLWDGSDWTQGPAGPPDREQHRLAYDAARQRVVLFGGRRGSSLEDTWLWDGTNWNRAAPMTSPGARHAYGMVYDRARQQVVLFGGWNDGQIFNETWVWDGVDWTELHPAAPEPQARFNLGMVYDEARERVVLFGGQASGGPNQVLSDAWEWDGTRWLQATPPLTPLARTAVMTTFDRANRHVVTFGGSTGRGLRTDETWLYFPQQPASFSASGYAGCASSGVIPTISRTQTWGNWPWPGTSFSISVQNLPANTLAAVMAIGFATPSTPINLGSIGAPLCDLLVAGPLEVRALVSPFTLQIPSSVGGGAEFFTQVFALEAAGLSATDRGDAVIGTK